MINEAFSKKKQKKLSPKKEQLPENSTRGCDPQNTR
jgi:hypothetical protein